MVTGRRVLAREDYIAEALGLCIYLAMRALKPSQRPDDRYRTRHIEAERISLAHFDPIFRLFLLDNSASTGVDWSIQTVRRVTRARDLSQDLLAGAEARVNQPIAPEMVESDAVVLDVPGLAAHRLFPFQTEPFEIV